MSHQILISTYNKDFVWLEYCLRSLSRFCKGFLPPAISVSGEDFAEAEKIVARNFPEAEVWIKDGPHGNLRAQISMMEGDLICPQADYVYLVGSDCLVYDDMRPEVYFSNEHRPIMLYNTYKDLEIHHPATLPWRGGTAHALGYAPPHEFMRRLPLLYPKKLFKAVRDHISEYHNMTFDDYVYSRAEEGTFSESNIMGAYAWKFMPELYTWVCVDGTEERYLKSSPRFPNPMIQFWSHGGLDLTCDADFEYLPGQSTLDRTPRDIIKHILGSD
jgi:hypothetical protein